MSEDLRKQMIYLSSLDIIRRMLLNEEITEVI